MISLKIKWLVFRLPVNDEKMISLLYKIAVKKISFVPVKNEI